VLESLFRFLFKYSPTAFQRGEVALAAPGGMRLAATLLAVAAAATVLTYASVRARTAPRDRGLLAGLRLAAVLVLLVALLRPVLVLSTTVPQRSFVAVLLDDSRSMTLDDGDGTARSRTALDAFAEGTPLRAGLEERFGVRFFGFSRTAARIEGPGGLAFQGTRTHLGAALDRVREEMSGVPLAGIVLVSDGGDNSREELSRYLLPLQAAGVPVFPVGVGRETLPRDIQVSRVEIPRAALRGSAVQADVVVKQTGFRGRSVELVVEDRGRIVATEPVDLAGDGEPQTVRVRFTAEDPGPRTLRFRIPAQEGEVVDRNNGVDALLMVEDRRDKILYFEGEPRHEVAFLRRAVSEDRNLQLVLLQRTYEDRFQRLDIDDPEELAAGFPRTREELFRYRGLVLGSVEASFFTPDQLRMIADFVSVRGGGLLALGGRRALAQGGYVGTAVADALPVVLDEGGASPEFWGEFTVRPTRAGETHAATQIGDSEELSTARWAELPPLSTFNPVTRVKPGATTLLTGAGTAFPSDQVVLAWQRYGRGKSLALPVTDLWMWRMHADIPLEDRTHQTLTRQLLRWVVDGVPDPVTARVPAEGVEPGEAATLGATVLDSAFVEVNAAAVNARVVAPDGSETELPLEWLPTRDGEYAGAFTPEVEGVYEVRVAAARGEESLGLGTTYLRVAPSDAEFMDPGLRASLLRRIADETGGRYHTAASLGSLPDDITLGGGGISVTEELPLWDMPVLLLLLLGLLGGEWALRRSRGLA
jgi:uncharacterized membrane protein